MTYTVTTTAGATVATIADGTVNSTATSLTLIGKNYAGYGIFLNENYVQLLENFSNSTPPTAPLTGQLWYDSTNDILKVFNGATNIWKPISSSISQGTAPSSSVSVTGDIWWDTNNAQLKVWSGSAWITIGPTYTTTSGTSGPVTESILDSSSNSHVVTKFYISNSVIAILSKDAAFTPQVAIPGFATIIPGFNLISSSTLTGSQFTGTTTGATTLDGFTSGQFLRSDISQTTSYPFGAAGGLTVGSDLTFDSTSPTVAVISGTTSNKNLRFDLNKAGVQSTALTITASTLQSSFSGNVIPSVHNTYNLGSSSNKWATIYGIAVNAQYADLAERFAADSVYSPGTVVQLGGVQEITAVQEELTEEVFGVISTRAGFLLNGEAGDDSTHPPVAMSGRVPVRVLGKIRKGDRLVSAGNGMARAANRNEITAFNVIGRSLESKTTAGEGVIEAIVKLNS